jgi:integrase
MQKRRYSNFKKYITDTEIAELDRYFSEAIKSAPLKLCYMLCRKLGLRVSDACRFHQSWIDGEVIRFTMQKTQRVLELPIPSDLKLFLDSYYNLFKGVIEAHDGYYCFSDRKNMHLSPNSLRYAFVDFRRSYNYTQPYYIRTGGINRPMYRLSVHVLRHRVLTEVYKKTKNIVLAQNIAGHTRPDTTLRYYIDDATLDEKKEALKSIN